MLTLQVPVLVLWFGESRVFVEERGYEGHVELCVSRHDISGGHKLSAAEAVGLFEHILCSLCWILLLVTHTHTHTDTDLHFVGGNKLCHVLDAEHPLR